MARSGPLRLERREQLLGGLAISGDSDLVMESGQAIETAARLDNAPERVTRQTEPILGEPQQERARHLEPAVVATLPSTSSSPSPT